MSPPFRAMGGESVNVNFGISILKPAFSQASKLFPPYAVALLKRAHLYSNISERGRRELAYSRAAHVSRTYGTRGATFGPPPDASDLTLPYSILKNICRAIICLHRGISGKPKEKLL